MSFTDVNPYTKMVADKFLAAFKRKMEIEEDFKPELSDEYAECVNTCARTGSDLMKMGASTTNEGDCLSVLVNENFYDIPKKDLKKFFSEDEYKMFCPNDTYKDTANDSVTNRSSEDKNAPENNVGTDAASMFNMFSTMMTNMMMPMMQMMGQQRPQIGISPQVSEDIEAIKRKIDSLESKAGIFDDGKYKDKYLEANQKLLEKEKAYTADKRRMEKELADLKIQKTDLEVEYATMRDFNENFEERRIELENHIKEKESELDALKNNSNKLAEEKKKLDQQNAELKRANDSFSSEIKNLNKELESAKERLDITKLNSEKEKQEAKDKIRELEKQLEVLTSASAGDSEQVNKLRIELENERKENEKTRQELSTVEARLDKTNNELGETRNKLNSANSKISEISGKLNEANRRVSEVQNELAEVQNKREEDDKHFNNKLDALRDGKKKLEDNINELLDKNKKLEEALSDSQQDLDSKSEELKKLMDNMADADSSFANLKAEYDKRETAINEYKERVRQLMEQNEALEKFAYTDQRTGVYNAAAFNRDFPAMFNEHKAALLMIGIRNMEELNQMYGRMNADGAVNGLSDSIRGNFEGARIYRVMSTRFAVFIDGATMGAITLQAQKIKDNLEKVNIKVCYGMATSTNEAYKSPEELIAAAENEFNDFKNNNEIAVAKAKELKKNSYVPPAETKYHTEEITEQKESGIYDVSEDEELLAYMEA